jgi:cystathionine beta-lyase/cystathionine gamma-synthase
MKTERPDDICPRPDEPLLSDTQPLAAPIYPTSVWRCASPEEADRLLGGDTAGYVYQRDSHPNADMLAIKCRQLHGAACAAITSSGMAALALALLSQTKPGDRILVSRLVYGKTLQLLDVEARRWGVRTELFDPTDAASCAQALTGSAALVVVETISNPCLRVADLRHLSQAAHGIGAKLLVDNTFATPILCRPFEWGADLVMESLSKMINGHSDVMLGALVGRQEDWQQVPRILSTWGFCSSPWDCWLSLRGLASLHLRMQRASANGLHVARLLVRQPTVRRVDYPGLATHPDHELAGRQLGGQFGSVVTFELAGGRRSAEAFIAAAAEIPFCPSLGEISTTLSHPESTSHRALSAAAREELGVTGGTIRLSCGVESPEFIEEALLNGLQAVDQRVIGNS